MIIGLSHDQDRAAQLASRSVSTRTPAKLSHSTEPERPIRAVECRSERRASSAMPSRCGT